MKKFKNKGSLGFIKKKGEFRRINLIKLAQAKLLLENAKKQIKLSKKKHPINSVLLTNFAFGFFPISFILGNAITNINLVLFCILGIFHLKSKILKFEFDIYVTDFP